MSEQPAAGTRPEALIDDRPAAADETVRTAETAPSDAPATDPAPAAGGPASPEPSGSGSTDAQTGQAEPAAGQAEPAAGQAAGQDEDAGTTSVVLDSVQESIDDAKSSAAQALDHQR